MSPHAWFDYNARLKSLDPEDCIDFEETIEVIVLETLPLPAPQSNHGRQADNAQPADAHSRVGQATTSFVGADTPNCHGTNTVAFFGYPV